MKDRKVTRFVTVVFEVGPMLQANRYHGTYRQGGARSKFSMSTKSGSMSTDLGNMDIGWTFRTL